MAAVKRAMQEPSLPSWWARENAALSQPAISAEEGIHRGRAAFDHQIIGDRLCSCGYAIIDGFLGAAAAAAIRDGVVTMERTGRLRVGKLQHGLTQTSDQTSRSDRIAFLPKGGEGCSDALCRYTELAEDIRERLSSHEELVKLVGGVFDGCNFMCSSYPGGGARYVKHRDALPYKAGRKLTAIYYLNSQWRTADGGELQLWPEDAPPVRVAPRADRLVIFISSLWHEVLPAWGGRCAPPLLPAHRSRWRGSTRARVLTLTSAALTPCGRADGRCRYALTTWMFNRRDTALEALAEDMRQKKAAGKMDTKALLAALDADSDFDDDDDDDDDDSDEDGYGDGKAVTSKAAMGVLMKIMQQKKAAAARKKKEQAPSEE